MKLKLFNGVLTTTTIQLTTGGFDPEDNTVVLIVRGEGDKTAGTLKMGLPEAHQLNAILATLPKVERVESVAT